jgi:hypothetical protein
MTEKKYLNIEPLHTGLKETTAFASYFFLASGGSVPLI